MVQDQLCKCLQFKITPAYTYPAGVLERAQAAITYKPTTCGPGPIIGQPTPCLDATWETRIAQLGKSRDQLPLPWSTCFQALGMTPTSFLSRTSPSRTNYPGQLEKVEKAHPPYHTQQEVFLALRSLWGLLDHRLHFQKIRFNSAQIESSLSQLYCHRQTNLRFLEFPPQHKESILWQLSFSNWPLFSCSPWATRISYCVLLSGQEWKSTFKPLLSFLPILAQLDGSSILDKCDEEAELPFPQLPVKGYNTIPRGVGHHHFLSPIVQTEESNFLMSASKRLRLHSFTQSHS